MAEKIYPAEINEAIAKMKQYLGNCVVEPWQRDYYDAAEELLEAAEELKRGLIEAGEALTPLGNFDESGLPRLDDIVVDNGEVQIRVRDVLQARKISHNIQLGFGE